MSEWRRVRWGDIATLAYGRSLDGYKNRAATDVRVYGTNGPIGYTDVALASGPGVVVGRKGAYRGVHYSPGDFYVIDTAFYLVPSENLDIRWAYYALLTQDINSLDSGSAIPSTSRESFYSLTVSVPQIGEQRAIAGVLGALDDKIHSNSRIRCTLLDFVDAFCKGLDVTDVTSEVGLRDILIFNYGKALPKSSRQVGTCPVVGSGGVDGFHAKSLVSAPVVVVGRAGQPGRVHLVLEDCWPIDSAFWISTLLPVPVAWVWSVLKSLDLARLQSGSAVPGLNREIAMSERVILPSTPSLEKIRMNTDPSIEKLKQLDRETETLVKLRSLLIPELLSGRLRVRDAEKVVEGAV